MKILLFLLFLQATTYAQLIAAWNTVTPPNYLTSDTTEVILVEFWMEADSAEIMNILNYSITNEDNNIIIPYSIHWIIFIDNISVDYTKLVALRVPRLEYRKIYSLTIFGESYSFFNNGFAPNLELKPEPVILK